MQPRLSHGSPRPGSRRRGIDESASSLRPCSGSRRRRPCESARYWPTHVSGGRVGVDRDGRLSLDMRDGVDVAARAGADDARCHPDRLGAQAEREAPLVELALGADERNARAIMIVEAGLLARHPREHPDVDLVVVVEQLVAPPVAIDDDERLPEIGPRRDAAHERRELAPRRARPWSSSSSDVRAASASENGATVIGSNDVVDIYRFLTSGESWALHLSLCPRKPISYPGVRSRQRCDTNEVRGLKVTPGKSRRREQTCPIGS